MKFFHSFLLVITLLTVFYAGCSSDDKGVTTPRPSCSDNIQNQGELGIDCGGPCNGCAPELTANVDGAFWEADGNINTSINGNSIIFLSGNGTSTLSMIYTGPFTIGIYNLTAATYGITSTGQNFIGNTGNITFISWNASEGVVSGSFNFEAYDLSGIGDTVIVTQGKFNLVPYQP
ncbi:MAG: hypothetical protein IPP34_03830 [Bacteroidetes bacterium]|nr:hypothetical protein [Bacteroidota bacterium]